MLSCLVDMLAICSRSSSEALFWDTPFFPKENFSVLLREGETISFFNRRMQPLGEHMNLYGTENASCSCNCVMAVCQGKTFPVCFSWRRDQVFLPTLPLTSRRKPLRPHSFEKGTQDTDLHKIEQHWEQFTETCRAIRFWKKRPHFFTKCPCLPSQPMPFFIQLFHLTPELPLHINYLPAHEY